MRLDVSETDICGPFVRIMMQFRLPPYAVFIKSIMLSGQRVLPVFAGIDFKAAASRTGLDTGEAGHWETGHWETGNRGKCTVDEHAL
jgi:hypothetical protein